MKEIKYPSRKQPASHPWNRNYKDTGQSHCPSDRKGESQLPSLPKGIPLTPRV